MWTGHVIPKGWKVLCWLRYVHTDPNNFDDPFCFNPDRYDVSVKWSGFQAFGAGARICVGNMFARTHLAIFLHHLSTGYKYVELVLFLRTGFWLDSHFLSFRWELVNPNAEMEYLSHQRPADGVEISITKI
ncbi:unnamed protein product [Linum tenue]|uniref:Cytochrome P450 n=1 Tax=Linum tenue TaxID=586396 RepID=A0AAV0IPB2_9ROSI|nr:unnamed protein product [Linum tenue]